MLPFNSVGKKEGWIIGILGSLDTLHNSSIICTKSFLQHLMLPLVLQGSVPVPRYFLWHRVPPSQLAGMDVGGDAAIQ